MSKFAQLADGRVLEFPDETPDDVMDNAVKRAIANPYSTKTTEELEKSASAPSTFRDVSEFGAMSLAGGIKSLTDLFGVDNAASKKMGELQEEAFKRLTPARQQELAVEEELKRRADEEGSWEGIKQAGKSFLRSPLQQTVGAGFSSLPVIAGTALAPEVSVPARIAAGTTLLPRITAKMIASSPAIGIGAGMGVGGQKGQDYAAVKQAMLDKGATEEEAEAAAIKASEYSLQNAPRQIGAGIAGGAEGALGVESLLGRAGRARAGVRGGPEAPTWGQAVGQSTFGEAIPEAIQSGVGAVGTNVALQQAGIDTDLFKGVAGEMTSGALAAAMLGTAVSPLQMRQLRQEFARDQLEKQIEEQKQKFEEYQKRQQTKENLGVNTLALPAPAPKVEDQDPLFNPLGNFSKEELGSRLSKIEDYRQKNGLPLLNSYSIEDVVDAMPEEDLNPLIEYKIRPGYQEVKYSPQDVLNAATDKVDTTTKGFRDFLNRTTGSSDLNTMTQAQLFAAFNALESLPVGQGVTILPEGSNASRFTEIQMLQGLESIHRELQKNNALTPEQTITKVKESTGLKNDRDAASLIKQLVKDNNLDTNADGNITAPTEISNLPAGYELQKGTFKQGEQQMYGVIDKDAPLEGVDTYTSLEQAQEKADSLNKVRKQQYQMMQQRIQNQQNEIDKSQLELDAMEAAGEGGTNEYKQAKAKHDALVEKNSRAINTLSGNLGVFERTLTAGPVGMKQVNRTGFTLFKDGVPVSTHPTVDAAMDSLVGTLPDAEVEALAQDKTPGMRTVARKARQRIEGKEQPQGIKVKTEKKPVAEAPTEKAPAVEVTDEDRKKAQVLAKALGRMLKKFGLGDVELQILKGMQDEGSYIANLIKIALDAEDAMGVLRHESIHALKDLGFFTDAQWATLERMAKEKWIDQYLKGVAHDATRSRYDAYVDEYKGKKSEAELEQLLIEEAIADAFRAFGDKPPPGFLTTIINKIKDFFARLKDAFGEAGIETAEEIFGRIERGGLRASKKVGSGQAKASVRNTTKGFLNPNLSAKQEKIINDVVDEMDLTPQEFASTSLIHQTGKAGVEQFESDKIGGLPEVVQFLQDERRKSGLPLLDIDKPEDRKIIAKLMATEAMAAIRSGGANLEWYDSIINKTLAMAGLKYEELNTDINARMAFKIATAITSQGLNVEDNLGFAMRVYDQFRENKRFPEIGQGEDQNAMIKNFKLANYLMDDMGANLLRQFLETEFTVEEMRSAGFDIKGELGDEVVLGSSVFGPKIGFGFYSNLNGNFDPVTMDMWFMRTIGRLTGKLKAFRQDLYNAQLQKFRDELDTEGDNGVFANQFDQDEIEIAKIDNDAAEDLARKVKSAHERDFKANRKAYDDGDREKSKLVAASETMIKSLDAPKDAPANGTERRNLRDIVRQMVDIVEDKYGKRVPPASLQAVIWYPEQELYKAMGVKLRVTSQNYAGAIEKILKGEGYGESDLSAAAKLGSRTAQQLAKSAVSKGSKKAGTESVRLGALEDREKETLLERRRRQLVLEEEKQTPKRMRVIYEVAPDPNNKALTESWRSLPNEDRIRISEKIGNEIIKNALKKFGLTGYVDTQVGSYLDDTNPSFALYLNSGDSVAMAKFLGFVLSQDSMMVVSPKAAKGLEKTGAVRINVGDATPERVDRIYQQLRKIEVDGNKPVGGQSYMNGHMVVLNYSDVSTDQLASLINERLDDKYEVITEDVYTAFPEKKDYDYANPSSDPRGNAGVLRQASRDLRTEATRLLQKELRQFKQESNRRTKEGETPVERKSLRSGSAVNAFSPREIDKESEVGYKSRDKLIDMNIDDFLSLAQTGFVASKQEAADKRVAEGTPFTSIPYLRAYPAEEGSTTYKVAGHEGRHRARALKKAGYTTMPVLLTTDIRFSEQNDPDKFDYKENWPEKLEAQEGASNPNFSIDFPVSREESRQSYQPAEKKSLRAPDTKAFKQWFGESKIVNEDGTPMVMYHGTRKDFAVPQTRGNRNAFFVSPDPNFASKYALNDLDWFPEKKGFGPIEEGAQIYPVYISAKKPFDYENDAHMNLVIPQFKRLMKTEEGFSASEIDDIISDFREGRWSAIEFANDLDLFELNGFDAFYTKEQGRKNLGVFKPQQVKSATGNMGTYSSESPDIRKSLRAPNTKEFNNWFDDSKVVDKEGRPVVMYHGTARDISEFKPGVANAIFVSPDPEVGAIYSADSLKWISENAADELTPEQKAQAIEDAVALVQEEYSFLNDPEERKQPDYKKMVARRDDAIKDIKKNAFTKKPLDEKHLPFLAQAVREYLPVGENIVPVFVRALNPFDYENKKHLDMVINQVLNFMPESVTTKMEFPEKYLAGLKGLLSRGLYNKIEDDAVQKAIRSLGFDSFYVKEHGVKNLGVYSPVQLKSATGNVGAYDINNPDIRKSLRPQIDAATQTRINETIGKRDDKSWLERLMTAIAPQGVAGFRQAYINRYETIGRKERLIAKMKGLPKIMADVSAESAALFSDYAAQLSASAFGVNDGIGGIPVYQNGITKIWNDNGKIKGPIAIFKPLAELRDPEVFRDWQFWMSAKRGSRLELDGREKLFTQADLAIAKNLEAKYPPGLFESVRKEWDTYNRGLVEYMIQTGVINKQMGESWMKHGDYFPFYRQQMDDDAKGPKVFSAISGVKAPKALKGGDVTVGDFFENVVRNTQSAIEAGMKNVAAERAIQNEVYLKDAVESLDFKGQPKRPSSMINVVTVLRNGQMHYYECVDAMFVEAMKGLNMAEIPGLQLFAAPANLLRSFVTKTPDFILANLLRDSMAAWVTSGAKITPIIDTAKGFTAALAGKDKDLQTLLSAGLIGGQEFTGKVRETGKTLEKQLKKAAGATTTKEKIFKPFKSVWEALEKGSTASDAATRLAVYKDTYAQTGNEAEALMRAMEIMNFQRKGSSALIRILTAVTPFLNARIQGLDVLYRAGIKPFINQDDRTAYDQAIAKAFIKRGLSLMALSCLYYAMVHDDEDYLAQEEETRDNNWLIPALGVKIPIPFEVGVIFKVMPERIMAYTMGNDTGEQLLASVQRNLYSTFGLQLPQAVLPAIEVATNYSFFTGRPIIGQGMEDVDKKFQVDPGTSKFAEILGEFTSFKTETGKSVGLSPIQIDHLIKGYTGTLGTYAVDAMDTVIGLNSDIPKPSRRFEQMPFIRRFALDPEARGNVTAYYELKNAVDQAVRTSNLLERTGKVEDFVEYQMDNMPLLASKDYVNALYKNLKEFNDMKRFIRSSTMDADDKRDALLAIGQSEAALVSQIRDYKKMIAQ